MRNVDTDILVIGSGAAGLSFALRMCSKYRITLITKNKLVESNTYYAQGGIAAAAPPLDSFINHINDTISAGDGLCNKDIVEQVIKAGPQMIDDLIKWGVKFTKSEKNKGLYDLTKEGGHSNRRIYHRDDTTGIEIQKHLIKQVKKCKNIKIYEYHMAVNLLTGKHGSEAGCYGAYVLDIKNNKVVTVRARAVLLAAGGAGKVYMYTSNPDVATGDGIAMAYRAGAKISNMEFIQFHPTCLYHPKAKSFLVSESVRGEGGKLRLPNNKLFMKKYHSLGDLAPRDVTARAIDFEMKKSGLQYVYLDITHKPAGFIKKRFPNIYNECLSLGIDMTREPIPVVPAAHYICGGIRTDKYGRTNIKNLFAAGETACTDLHGANRLASNSLLEALFFANNAFEFLKDNLEEIKFPKIKPWNPGKAVDSSEQVMITHNWYEIRRLMWNYVGIVRSEKRLARARRRLDILKTEIQEYYWGFNITAPLLELRNLVTVADIIVKSAIHRKESRGLHYSLDYPKKNKKQCKDTIIQRKL
ncbi:L-aspartate oxidase [bacterium]